MSTADWVDDDGKFTAEGETAFRAWFAERYEPDDGCSVMALEIANAFERDHKVEPLGTEVARILRADVVPEDITPGFFGVRERDELGIGWGNAPPQPVAYLVDGAIPRGSVGMFVGAPNEGKTWAVLSLDSAVANGESWMGHDVEVGRVVHVDFEMGREELDRRLRIVDGAEVRRTALPKYTLTDERFWTELAKVQPKLVSVDGYARGNPATDENDPRFAEPLARARRFAEAHGTTFVFVHHSPKATGKATLLEIIRGTSALAANLDVAYYVEGKDDFESDDPRERRATITCKKMRRGGHEPAPMTIRITDAGVDHVADPARGRPPIVAASAGEDDARVLEAITADPACGTRRGLVAATGLSQARVMAARQRLLDAGKIVRSGGTDTAPVYQVPQV